MNIYFIDYENTKLHGLYGIEKLGRFDKVVIFYSENAQSITIDCMKSINNTKAKVMLEQAEIGRHDFLDFQLSSYLGYMAHKHPFANFFIVSADKGYECLESFWKNKGIKVTLIPNIANEEEKPTLDSKPTKNEKAVSSKKNKTTSKTVSNRKSTAAPSKTKVKLSKKSYTQSKKNLPPITKQTKDNKTELKAEPKSEIKSEIKSKINSEIKPEIKQETLLAAKPQTAPTAEKKAEKSPAVPVYSKLDAPVSKQKEEPIITEKAKETEKTEKPSVALAEIKQKSLSLATVKKEKSTSLTKTSDSEKSSKKNVTAENGKTNEALENLVSLIGDRKKAEAVSKILSKTNDKSEVHNELQQIYGAQAKEIYDKIVPLLTTKPSTPPKKSSSTVTYSKENYSKYYRQILELIHNPNESKIVTEIILSSKSKAEVHCLLQQSLNKTSPDRATEVYRLIKPILNDAFSKA